MPRLLATQISTGLTHAFGYVAIANLCAVQLQTEILHQPLQSEV